MRTGAAERLGDAVSHLFTDADGTGTFYSRSKGTRRRGANSERDDRVEVIELDRILGLDIEEFELAGKVTTEDDNPFDREEMTQPEFVLGMGAAREHRPPVVEWACNLRVHRNVCSTAEECQCVEHRFPDNTTLFARSLSPKEAMIDLDLIRIYKRAARRERKRWKAVRLATRRIGEPAARPSLRLARIMAVLSYGTCDSCGGAIAAGEWILAGRGDMRHSFCLLPSPSTAPLAQEG